MNRPTAFVLLFLLATMTWASNFVTAQDPPLPLPPPAKDYFPNTWEEFSFPDGQFRIRFPRKPQETMTSQGAHEIHSIQYKGLLTYRITYVDYKARIDNPETVKETLQAIKSAGLTAIQDRNVQLLTEREVAVDGHAGIFVHLEVRAKEVFRFQWVIAGSRLYIISAESRKGSPQELEGKDDFEKVAIGFISSFHVTP
jgi:hypothetical protein